MTIEAKIVGFDRSSDLAAVELAVPRVVLAQVKRIADVPASDPDLLGSYPLDDRQVIKIAETAHITVDPVKYAYFLEAYDE